MSAEHFEGFSWPVPRAFASAISACRFEQGDVFYSHARAYRAWQGSGPKFDYQLQVLDPPKTTRALAGDGEGKRFFAHWDSPVEFELSTPSSGEAHTCHSTQGRLFTCLWRGDVAWLDEETGAPVPPALQRELHKALDASVAAFRRALDARDPAHRRHCLYIGVVDQASEASRDKARSVRAALEEGFEVESIELRPGAAGVECAEGFHPALSVRGLCVATRDAAAIEARLKSLLYTPSAVGDEKADRFSLARHGLLREPAD